MTVRLGGACPMPRDVPLLLEYLSGPEYAVARDAVFAVGDEIGVGFKHRQA